MISCNRSDRHAHTPISKNKDMQTCLIGRIKKKKEPPRHGMIITQWPCEHLRFACGVIWNRASCHIYKRHKEIVISHTNFSEIQFKHNMFVGIVIIVTLMKCKVSDVFCFSVSSPNSCVQSIVFIPKVLLPSTQTDNLRSESECFAWHSLQTLLLSSFNQSSITQTFHKHQIRNR